MRTSAAQLRLIGAKIRTIWPGIKPYRDAFAYLVFSAVFSLLPPIAAWAYLNLFSQWSGDWFVLLRGGDLVMASACLMASSLWILRKFGDTDSVLHSASWLVAVVVLVFDCLVYAALSLRANNLMRGDVQMSANVLMTASVGLYGVALLIGFYALVKENKLATIPSNPEIRNQQVQDLERQLENLEDNP